MLQRGAAPARLRRSPPEYFRQDEGARRADRNETVQSMHRTTPNPRRQPTA